MIMVTVYPVTEGWPSPGSPSDRRRAVVRTQGLGLRQVDGEAGV